MQQTTRVVTQIEHQTLQLTLLDQLFQVLHQGGRGLLLKLHNTNVAIARLDQLGLDALHLDDFPDQGDDNGLCLTLAGDGQHDGGLRLATHALDRIVEGHALHGSVVQLDDQVTRLDAGTKGGGVLNGRDHLDETIFRANLNAQATKLALSAHLQFLEGFGIQIGRVGIKIGQHAADGVGDQLLVVNRLDIALLDGVEDIGQVAQLFHGQRGQSSRLVRVGREVEADQNPGTKPGEHQAGLLQSCCA
jgi:hypothetical protein